MNATYWGIAVMAPACLLAPLFADTASGQQTNDQRAEAPEAQVQSQPDFPTPLLLTVGKSIIVDSDLPFERIAVGYGDIAEGSAISARQLLVSGKTPGITSLVIWREGGTRRF